MKNHAILVSFVQNNVPLFIIEGFKTKDVELGEIKTKIDEYYKRSQTDVSVTEISVIEGRFSVDYEVCFVEKSDPDKAVWTRRLTWTWLTSYQI